MIVTVTPNPSIDRTVRIGRLLPGELVRATAATAEAGGKGVNIARVLAAQGRSTVAVVPLSAASRPVFAGLLGGMATLASVRIARDVRVNVSLIEADGRITKVNEPGPELTAAETASVLRRATTLAQGAGWVVGTGSLPPGAPIDFYARLGRALPAGCRYAVDADGEPLRAAFGARVDLVKPNHAELERLVGRSLPTLGDVVDAAEEVRRDGPAAVLVSLGPDGALLVDADGRTHAEARIDDVDNTVGAGDALLGGFLAAGADHAALRTAVAWSVAACRSPGTQVRVVERRDLEVVIVHAAVVTTRRLAA